MEPMTIVGVVTNLVSKSLEAMGKAALKEVASWWGARYELKKLENTMRLIKARVHDAEKRQEEDGSEAIKGWLRRLKLVLYQADDLFDEVLTLDRQKQRMESRMFGKVGILFSKSGPVYHNINLAFEIRSIRKELEDIKSDTSVLNLRDLPPQQLPMNRLIEKRETASLVNTDFVISRDKDQNNILEILFDPKYDVEKVTVIPIVGFGGLGKTTLAQLVFNDQRVKTHFDLTKWAYVPEVDNLNAIMRKIYNSFKGGNHDKLPLEDIKQGIRKSIDNKKYLLVLDDLWDEGADRLIDLMSLLRCGNGNQASKVIVTTRSKVVARVVGTIDRPYMLGTLTDGQSWDLFKLVAFKHGNEDDNSTFNKIGKEIVNMCGNVPLAIKVVGGFLRSKDSEKEWLQARDAQRSKAELTKGDDIMDVLKLSYDYLPPALKQCFAYCSLFPKGCRFDREDLVYMWMAQGYFKPSNNEIGDTLYMNMLARGFFQDPEFSDRNVKNCKMHDLLHDLAQHVGGEESLIVDDESSIQITNGLLHVNLGTDKAEVQSSSIGGSPGRRMRSSIGGSPGRRMRSLISTVRVGNKDLKDLISRLQHLRVLKVEKFVDKKLPDDIGRLMHLRYLYIQSDEIEYLPDSITRLENLQTLHVQLGRKLKKLPDDIGRLMHLRYLYIESDEIEYLPDSIARLKNLQTLHVQLCRKLKELPSDFAKLTNITHLLLPNTIILWSELPRGFGKLTSLQVLNEYIVGENNGIDSLPVLNYRGKLVIRFSKWRRNGILEAQRANLKNCDELTSLQLRFEEDVRSPLPPDDEMKEMLMDLELPPNLRHLEVHGYKGEKMPSRWFDGLSKLVSIQIRYCWNCKVVPTLSHLHQLKRLELISLRDLEMEEQEETEEEEGNSSRISREWQGLTSLRELTLKDIRRMEKIPAGITGLTTLEQLNFIELESLIELPEEIGNLSLLRLLQIIQCPKLKLLPTSLLSHTTLKIIERPSRQKKEILNKPIYGLPDEIGPYFQ